MKVLLLNLPSPTGLRVLRDFGGGFGTASTITKGSRQTIFPPLHETFAAAILEKEGFEVSVLDGQTRSLSPSELLAVIEKQNPAVIICRVSAPSFTNDLMIISLIKEKLPNIFLVGWGSLCKMAAQEVLDKSKLDLVVGEAELEFVVSQVLERIQSGKSPDSATLQNKVRYVDYSENQIVRNLDMLPPPAYHLLNMKEYVAEEYGFVPGSSRNRMLQFSSVLGSHGCSFNCMYCVYPVVFGKWRGRSPTKMVDDVEVLVKNYSVKVIWFEDQAFSMDVNRAAVICDEIIKRHLDVYWACETRADKLPAELLRKMKKAGCSRIQLGIETGDPSLFKKLGKSGCNLETVTKSIKAIQNEGIILETNFIVGLPGESWETVKGTAAFIDKFKPDVFSVSLATPYPGTELYDLAERNNWIVTKDWNKYGLSKPVLNMPTFTAQDMEKAREYLVSEASFKRQLNQTANDLRHGKLGKVAKDVFANISQVPKQVYRLAKRKTH